MKNQIHSTEIPLRWIQEEGTRLDASFYTQDSIESRVLLDELEASGIDIESIGELSSDVFHQSRFKRDYVHEGEGEPYVTPTDMFMFPLEPRKFIANPPDGLKAEPGWILLTCSGTIGRTRISNDFLSECILTHDLIRILPETDDIRGYLYAYLNCWVGQALLTKDEYGATVKHVEPHHVESIPVPRLPDVEEEVNNLVQEMYQNREQAERVVRSTDKELYSTLELPRLEEFESDFLSDGDASARMFTTNSRKLNNRLDAPYHKPIIQKVTAAMDGSPFDTTKLGEILSDMFVPGRFKRPYVDNPDDGIPFLSGSHLVQIKPLDVKYLWAGMDGIEDVILEEGWVLMSRSGTVGRMRIVDESISDWAASEHVLRLLPKDTIHPGYLMAFLKSSYGQVQIDGKVYGAVVDEIAESDTSLIEDIDIVLPPFEIQERIGDMIFEAYEQVGKAISLENEAIQRLEYSLESAASD